jgi:hypothetical protein
MDAKEYIMGVDTYDKHISAVCVISKNKTDNGNKVCEYISRPKTEDLDAEIKRVAEFYKIPVSKILRETD